MPHPAGLCATCTHARRVDHPRGDASYWRCALSETDPAFPRYPRLPVRDCEGFAPYSDSPTPSAPSHE